MRSLLTAHLAFKKNIEMGLKNYGLNPGNPKIILYIAEHEGCSQKELAEYCFVESATLSSVLSKMEKNGLIERRHQGNDRRAYAIYPTQEGQHVFKAVKEQFEDTVSTALSGFTRKEAKEFRAYLQRVTENLESTNEDGSLPREGTTTSVKKGKR